MKLVILDSYTTNPGDLSLAPIQALGEVTVYQRTPPECILQRAQGFAHVLLNKSTLNASQLDALPDLRYIGLMSTGTNAVDLAYAKQKGITVTNVPAYSTESVVQLTITGMLEHFTRVQEMSAAVAAGEWAACPDFCFWHTTPREVAGKTLGIYGMGAIGRRVAQVALALGMRVLGTRRTPDPTFAPDGFAWADFDQLLRESDVLTLHAPLTPQTQGLINRDTLARMKRGAILINAARGPLLVDADVADALNSGQLGGLSCDVLTQEPPGADNPLLHAKNTIITPHIAWATLEARTRLVAVLAQNLQAFMAGRPQNVVNP